MGQFANWGVTGQEPVGNRSHCAVDSLKLHSPILDGHPRQDGRGKVAEHPDLLVRLLVYGEAVRKRSSRQLEREVC